jgi:DNA-directed RNA polymerase specialized sigma24 family protein
MADDAAHVQRFEDLFDRYHWPVRAYVRRRASPAAVDDVVAETFLVAWRRLDAVGDDPLPWLLGVARRQLANHHRADRRRGALLDRLRSGAPAGPRWDAPAGMSPPLTAAITALSDREREALLLVAWEDLDPTRAAQVVGCSAAAFRVRLHRARRRVAAALDCGSPSESRPSVANETS